jgi:hypothetical protein
MLGLTLLLLLRLRLRLAMVIGCTGLVHLTFSLKRQPLLIWAQWGTTVALLCQGIRAHTELHLSCTRCATAAVPCGSAGNAALLFSGRPALAAAAAGRQSGRHDAQGVSMG